MASKMFEYMEEWDPREYPIITAKRRIGDGESLWQDNSSIMENVSRVGSNMDGMEWWEGVDGMEWWEVVAVAVGGYLLLLSCLPPLLRRFRPSGFGLQLPLACWNLFLSLLSVCMFFGMLFPIADIAITFGYYHLVCMPFPYGMQGKWKGYHCFWMWLFSMSKIFELVDTLFLVLRGRKVGFLHWYHHTTVLIYTWFSTVTMAPTGWSFAIVNAFVHSIMYMYYFLTTIGIRPSWGSYVTIIQLMQMVVGIILSLSWDYYYFAGYPAPVRFEAHAYVVWAPVVMYTSYFILFLRFYLQRGKKPTAKKD